MTILHTRNLTLSPCSPADRADFVALEQDAEVMRFLNGGAVDRDRVGPDADFLMPEGTESYVWTARRAENRSFVGWFCLEPESEGLAELGYRLRRADWGQGFASEGAMALVDWGFSTAGYDRIVATTMAVNTGSRGVMRRIGMNHVRTEFAENAAPIPGYEQGEVWYELTRETWNAARR